MAHIERLEEIAAVKAAFTVVTVALGVLGGHLQAWETRRKHDAGSLPLNLWNLPVPNEAQSTFADLFHRR